MNSRYIALLERRVPQIAAHALAAANRRALKSGLPLVFVADGGVYRLKPGGERELIEALPPRTKVASRVKYATS